MMMTGGLESECYNDRFSKCLVEKGYGMSVAVRVATTCTGTDIVRSECPEGPVCDDPR